VSAVNEMLFNEQCYSLPALNLISLFLCVLNEELYDLIMRVFKSRMRQAEHGARVGDRRGAYRGLVGRLEG
jgi:hypothetical protein